MLPCQHTVYASWSNGSTAGFCQKVHAGKPAANCLPERWSKCSCGWGTEHQSSVGEIALTEASSFFSFNPSGWTEKTDSVYQAALSIKLMMLWVSRVRLLVPHTFRRARGLVEWDKFGKPQFVSCYGPQCTFGRVRHQQFIWFPHSIISRIDCKDQYVNNISICTLPPLNV